MAVDREEIETLRAEAKRIRKNFRYIQQDLKRTPENIDLLRQRDRLKNRYGEIQALLNKVQAAHDALPDDPDEDSDPHAVDMSIFEPKPFEIPAAVTVKHRGAASGGSGGTRFTAKDVRTTVSVLILILVVPFFYLYVVKGMRFYNVPSRSMEPALLPGDRIVAIRPNEFVRGDVVVLPDPNAPGEYLVKRLVAFGGDTVEIANGNLFINGQPIDEPYVAAPAADAYSPITVADGEVYLLGDNRNTSEDSRAWEDGTPESELLGRVLWIYSPANRRGIIPDYSSAFSDVPIP